MFIMGKKLVGGLFAGLLGAGLYAAYQKMDETKKNRLKRDFREKTDELRDRAVDYAFYANDAVSDFKDAFKDELNSTKGNVKDASSSFADKAKSFKTAKDSDGTDVSAEEKADQDDIIVDARDAFNDSDYSKATKSDTQDDANLSDTDEEKDNETEDHSNSQPNQDHSDNQ
ncbi:YtxH domain-containing protein [Lentilactobacillus hilgardii]|uniref:YtxH domain-containing protein n=1 Tax=Lentilactobacillus hilgardii TaxID=1588 RepID=UPI00019C5F21|nr:YtxH domain-containing protein [Lentilactobacillus hilgardii]EEI19027.1 hypothetical protein HMPREF0497_2262 [Lentilactobacillus buchneri ATCC 11577]MCT3395487.1 YtxH domain-containing protein [Lentilactobacillus hilgardii]